jgi:hypothetical protein
MKSFRGRLVLKERSIADVVLTLGEAPIPNKPGRVEWWGQCRLAKGLRSSVGAVLGEAAIELEDGRIGKIHIADFRSDTGFVRFCGNGELKVSHDCS